MLREAGQRGRRPRRIEDDAQGIVRELAGRFVVGCGMDFRGGLRPHGIAAHRRSYGSRGTLSAPSRRRPLLPRAVEYAADPARAGSAAAARELGRLRGKGRAERGAP